jgi:hypothetical protein
MHDVGGQDLPAMIGSTSVTSESTMDDPGRSRVPKARQSDRVEDERLDAACASVREQVGTAWLSIMGEEDCAVSSDPVQTDALHRHPAIRP